MIDMTLFPLKDQTLTVMDFNKHWWKDLSQQAQDMRGMNDKSLPSDYGMLLTECNWVNQARYLKMKWKKSFDLWQRTDKTDSNSCKGKWFRYWLWYAIMEWKWFSYSLLFLTNISLWFWVKRRERQCVSRKWHAYIAVMKGSIPIP